MATMRALWIAFAAAALAATTLGVAADTWPSKPTKLVVPYPPGGTSDIAARLVAERLTGRLGQTVFVENKAGVSGILGTEAVSKATPDGYTMLLTSLGPLAFAPSTPKKVSYDPVKNFTHVAMIGSLPLVLVVNSGFAPKSLNELAALAKSKPGVINFGSSGPATPSHLMLERVKARLDVDITHVPYKGSGPLLTDIIGGSIDGAIDALPAMLPMIKSGRVRALAVTGQQRHPLLPDVPTMVEAGHADLVAASWFGIAVPAGTPQEIVQRLNKEINQELQMPAVQSRFAELAFATSISTPDEMQKFVSSEIERWRPVVVAAKISFE